MSCEHLFEVSPDLLLSDPMQEVRVCKKCGFAEIRFVSGDNLEWRTYGETNKDLR